MLEALEEHWISHIGYWMEFSVLDLCGVLETARLCWSNTRWAVVDIGCKFIDLNGVEAVLEISGMCWSMTRWAVVDARCKCVH